MGAVFSSLKEFLTSPGYWGYVFISLGFVGGLGLWLPLALGTPIEENAMSFAFVTYGGAITSGMLLDLVLRQYKNVEVSVLGAAVVLLSLALLLVPVFRNGQDAWYTYTGTGLIVTVWVLANVHTYADMVTRNPKAAVAGDADGAIEGDGLDIDD